MVRPLRERESDAGLGITANPAAKLTYDAPAVQTYTPSTGWDAPASVSSYSNMAPVGSQATYAPATKQWVQPQPYTQVNIPQATPAPPTPPQGGKTWYNGLDAGAKAQTEADFLGGDADYTAQLGEYDRALNDFIARIKTQKDNFDLDSNNAVAANSKNLDFSANALGEDFGARGMLYSGLVDKAQGDLRGRFNDQQKNIELVRDRNKSDADNRLTDYSAENNIGRSNAKRSALTRMAAQQALIDSNAGF